MAETIVTRAPTRIDFGGGWTDVPPISDEIGGFVCNLAIARYATVTVVRDGDHAAGAAVAADAVDRGIVDAAARRFRVRDLRIEVQSDFPVSAGLGGSSAVGVAVVAALSASRGERMQAAAVAELSREIEINDLGIPGGRQDHYAAAYGGALGLRFAAGGRVQVREIGLDARTRAEIEKRFLVLYTGQSRISGETINAVIDAYKSGDKQVIATLRHMKEIAEFMPDTLANGDLDALGRLVAQQWKYQRALHPAIPTPEIDDVIARATQAGAVGAKALGASGGGCVLVIASAANVDRVKAAIAPLGELLPFKVDERGVERCK